MTKATIFSILGSAGVVVTSVLSVKCSKKIKEQDDIKIRAKKYLPAIISGSVSIGCIMAADKINKKEIAALTASVGYFAKKFTDYEKEVREIVGDEKADEIEQSFYTKQLEKQTDEKLLEDKNTFKFIDSYSGASIIAPYDKVVAALKQCEDIYRKQGYFCWCDIFYLINESCDLYDSYLGETVGWSRSMYEQFGYDNMHVHFKLKQLDDDKFLIDYSLMPEFGFMEY